MLVDRVIGTKGMRGALCDYETRSSESKERSRWIKEEYELNCFHSELADQENEVRLLGR